MINDISDYCRSCQTCALSKSQPGKPHGKLKTMPVPTYPWQYIGVDFVGPLPESTNRTGGYDMICVVIDQLTSMVHAIPSKQTYRATDIAELMFENVYRLHGLPERIVSDRDSLFTSKFWKRLHHLLGTELRMSSAFHPQTDGATERANRTLTQMIRQCVGPNQKDWVTKLPAIEFAINSARSSTTGFSPFQLNYGRNPSPMIWRGQDEFPGVRQFAEQMKLAIMSAHDSIIAARVVNTVQANRKRAIVDYSVGDLVYLSTKNISLPKGRARKLAPKFLGPFAITKVLKEGATYQLDLSEELLKRGINRSFHASLLKPHVPNDDRRFPGRLPSQLPGFSEKSDEWIVDAIVSHHGKGTRSEFEIQWKAGDRTWAPYREVAHLIAMDRYCELMGVENPSDLPAAYPKREMLASISVHAVRLGEKAYIRPGLTLRETHPTTPIMAVHLSYEEWEECDHYERRLSRHRREGSPHPGPPPPRFEEYREAVGLDRGPTSHSRESNARYAPDLGAIPPAPHNAVTVTPEVLTSFFDAQYRMASLAVRHGTTYAPRPVIPYPSFYRSYRAKRYRPGRGGYRRGRGSARDGRFGPGRGLRAESERRDDPPPTPVPDTNITTTVPDINLTTAVSDATTAFRNSVAELFAEFMEPGPSSLVTSTPAQSIDSISTELVSADLTESLNGLNFDPDNLQVEGDGNVDMEGANDKGKWKDTNSK